MINPNPVVMRGICRLCLKPVALFASDADEYLTCPWRGLAHFDCQAAAANGPG